MGCPFTIKGSKLGQGEKITLSQPHQFHPFFFFLSSFLTCDYELLDHYRFNCHSYPPALSSLCHHHHCHHHHSLNIIVTGKAKQKQKDRLVFVFFSPLRVYPSFIPARP